jgi:hypothetical protein
MTLHDEECGHLYRSSSEYQDRGTGELTAGEARNAHQTSWMTKKMACISFYPIASTTKIIFLGGVKEVGTTKS